MFTDKNPWTNRNKNAKLAQQHTEDMEEKYSEKQGKVILTFLQILSSKRLFSMIKLILYN